MPRTSLTIRLLIRAEHVVGQAGPVGRHRVLARHRPDRADPAVGAVIAHHADRIDRQQDARRTARHPRPAASSISSRTIASAWRSSSRSCGVISPSMRTARPGPGNGWRSTISSGRPERPADRADLVLEQVLERLDQLELHVFWQTADVVVRLDLDRGFRVLGRRSRSRPDRACPGPGTGTAPTFSASASKTRMNVSPIVFRFCSGIGDTRQPLEEMLGRVDIDEVHAEGAGEDILDQLRLAEPKQPVVDEDRGQLLADRPVDQRGRDRRIDSAAQPAAGPGRSPTCCRICSIACSTKEARRPGRLAAADLGQEVAQDRPCPSGVCATSGWNWIATVLCPCAIAAQGALSLCADRREAVRHLVDVVAVAHPDIESSPADAGKERRLGSR